MFPGILCHEKPSLNLMFYQQIRFCFSKAINTWWYVSAPQNWVIFVLDNGVSLARNCAKPLPEPQYLYKGGSGALEHENNNKNSGKRLWSEPIQTYYQLQLWKQTSMKFKSKWNNYLSTKLISLSVACTYSEHVPVFYVAWSQSHWSACDRRNCDVSNQWLWRYNHQS